MADLKKTMEKISFEFQFADFFGENRHSILKENAHGFTRVAGFSR